MNTDCDSDASKGRFMSRASKYSISSGLLAVALIAGLWACGGPDTKATAASPEPAPPSPEGGKYEAVEVKDGGSISGVVKWAGPPPAATPLPVTKDNETCGKEKPNQEVLVGKDGGLKN